MSKKGNDPFVLVSFVKLRPGSQLFCFVFYMSLNENAVNDSEVYIRLLEGAENFLCAAHEKVSEEVPYA